ENRFHHKRRRPSNFKGSAEFPFAGQKIRQGYAARSGGSAGSYWRCVERVRGGKAAVRFGWKRVAGVERRRSDYCAQRLGRYGGKGGGRLFCRARSGGFEGAAPRGFGPRSEERRVGKECRCGWVAGE